MAKRWNFLFRYFLKKVAKRWNVPFDGILYPSIELAKVSIIFLGTFIFSRLTDRTQASKLEERRNYYGNSLRQEIKGERKKEENWKWKRPKWKVEMSFFRVSWLTVSFVLRWMSKWTSVNLESPSFSPPKSIFESHSSSWIDASFCKHERGNFQRVTKTDQVVDSKDASN